jgi:hypothetical protein
MIIRYEENNPMHQNNNTSHTTRTTRFTKKATSISQDSTKEQFIISEKTAKASDDAPTSTLNEKLDHLIQTNKSTEQLLLLMLQ